MVGEDSRAPSRETTTHKNHNASEFVGGCIARTKRIARALSNNLLDNAITSLYVVGGQKSLHPCFILPVDAPAPSYLFSGLER